MAEFNPYKLEEEKWTPNNVYEILPPNAVSWTNYQYSEGSDNVDTEAANKSLIDGFVDFFAELLGTAGQILGGAVELGGAVLGGFVDGVVSLIGGIANAIGSIFGGGSSESPNLPLFNPIKTNLEAAIQPHRDKINESLQKTEEILAEQAVLRGQMDESLQDMREARDRANEAIEKSGQSIAEAQAASAAATEARETLEAYNTALNQRITTEFNSAVGRADTAVEKADTLAGELADFKAQHQLEINDAVGKAEQAVADLATLSPKVTDAVAKANKATNDVSTLTPKVTAAQSKADSAYTEAGKVRSEVTPKIEAAQTKGESALAVADKAVDWLRNPNEIGASLIAIDPETNKPNWAEHLDPATAEENPLNLPNAYKTGATYSRNPRPMAVNIDPTTEYVVSLWVKADKPGSNMTFDMRDQNGAFPFAGARPVDGFLNAGDSGRAYWIKGVPTEWTQYKKIATPRETSRTARFGVSYFKHGSGDTTDVVQYIADLQIYPLVPSQLDVDQAQNDAIKANQDILRQQGEINEAQRVANLAQKNFNDNQTKWNNGVAAALDAQKKVNDNFKIWSDGAATAIEANTKAIAALSAPNSGASLMPVNPLTNEPYYVSWAGDRMSLSSVDRVPERVSVKQTSTAKVRYDAPLDGYVLSKLNKGTVYRWSVWVYSSVANSDIRLFLKDPVRGISTKNILGDEGVTVADSRWGIILPKVPKGWSMQSGTIEFDDEADHIYLYAVEWNSTNLSVTQYFAGLDIYPDVPTQASVDKAQNDAISANTEALKALGKKVLGASLVPYKTPSTQEVKDYAAGKLNYDPWADPEYLNAGHSIATPARGRVARANADQKTKNFTGSYVTVDSNIEYKVKFHTYASASGSNLFIYMRDQNGKLALAETPFTNTSKTAGGLVHNLTLPAGIKEWSGVIKFKPGTTQVRLDTFYWNHSNGSTTATQEFGGLEIVPNIPDANVVNELQDNAIRKNTEVGSENKKAIEALRDGLNAAVELGEVSGLIADLRGELEAEAKKREALQEKIDALQTEMIPRTIVNDDRVTYDDYINLSGNKVTAKGNWAGQLAITYTDRSGSGTDTVSSTLVTRKSVPDGTTRSWTISGGWDSRISIQRVDYWVYRGRPRTILLINPGPYITGSSFSSGTWGVLATHKVGKTYGTGKIEWKANLLHADRGVTYRFKIEVNGVEVKNVSWTNQGPLTPLGDGKRTLKFEHEFNLPDDATVRLLGYATKASPFNAEVSLLQGTLVYVEDESR